jgi:anti-sigma B factor antagonist
LTAGAVPWSPAEEPIEVLTPIETRSFSETTLISLRGRHLGSDEGLERRLLELIDGGCRRLVVELGEATALDSALVRTLFRASLAIEEAGGQIWLVYPPRLARSLALIGAADAFTLAGSLADALRAAGAEGRATPVVLPPRAA